MLSAHNREETKMNPTCFKKSKDVTKLKVFGTLTQQPLASPFN